MDALISSCQSVLKEGARIGLETFGPSGLPITSVMAVVMEPSASGGHSGKEMDFSELDTPKIFAKVGAYLESTTPWEKAKEAIQGYIDEQNIQPGGLWLHDINDHYLWPLFINYLREENSFAYNPDQAEKWIRCLLQHLQSDYVQVFGLIVLQSLSADRAFSLGQNIHLHPINEEELHLLGRSSHLIPPGRYRFPNPLSRTFPFAHTDWWICKITLQNPRGTAEAYDKLHQLMQLVASALRVFKEGKFSLNLALSGEMEDFGRLGFTFNNKLYQIGTGPKPYRLSHTDVDEFIVFWEKFRRIMEREKHYLQVPVRRLRAAGTRSEREDALVDYVIGLEALLGAEDERTELSYRFRVRGAVVLSKERSERKSYLGMLARLYNLRSRLVHGGTVSAAEVEENLPVAESALRRIWLWYFENWAGHADNKAALAWIDEELVGK